MKINGQKITGPNTVMIVIPRGNDNQLVFTATAVLSYTDFNTLCPPPVARMKMVPGGGTTPMLDDPKFVKQQEKHSGIRFQWMVLKSLQATENLEWETVDMNDPATWGNYETELQESGMSEIEIGRIARGVMQANALDEEMVEAARTRFLASQLEADSSESLPQDEQENSSSGEPANVSESDHPE